MSLLQELWKLQQDDVPMTAATLVEVRHQTHDGRTCNVIQIKTPTPNNDKLDKTAVPLRKNAVPNFIWCQLLDQKLIELRNFQDTIALHAALSVICSAYATPETADDDEPKHPTTFNWHCSKTHRSHIIFAYITFEMKSRAYTVEELLNLRSACSYNALASVAFRDSELGQSPSISYHVVLATDSNVLVQPRCSVPSLASAPAAITPPH